MNRIEVYNDITKVLGRVPGFLKALPDESIEQEWELFKSVQLNEGPIPAKYKHLIGVATAAATHCKYCVYFHSEVARLHGASDAEIEDAAHIAKNGTSWSTYLHGIQSDFDEFKRDVNQVCYHIRNNL